MEHLSAEHLIQITQALGSSNIGVRNIKSSHDNFLIGRQLSKYGGTSRLTSAMRVYLNYQNINGGNAPENGLQPITFITILIEFRLILKDYKFLTESIYDLIRLFFKIII